MNSTSTVEVRPGRPALSTLAALACATAGGSGLLRPGPGTWGSVVGCIIAWGILAYGGGRLGLGVALLASSLLCLATAPAACRWFRRGDPSQVVLDEVAGVLAGCVLLPGAGLGQPLIPLVAVFILFRVLDIAKPFPINRLEALPGAFGILADDLGAGLLAGIVVMAIL